MAKAGKLEVVSKEWRPMRTSKTISRLFFLNLFWFLTSGSYAI